MNKILMPGQNSTPNPGKDEQMAQLMEMLKHSTAVKCEECDSSNFIEIVRIRKVSGLVTGLGREMLIPVPVFACADCGNVNEVFMKSSGLDAGETDTPEETESNEPTDEQPSSLIIPGK